MNFLFFSYFIVMSLFSYFIFDFESVKIYFFDFIVARKFFFRPGVVVVVFVRFFQTIALFTPLAEKSCIDGDSKT